MAELLLETIQRAKTYQILKWHYHNPIKFNPYRLASKGYQCTALNTLECHICHNQVTMTTNDGQQRHEDEINKQLQNHSSSCCYKDEEYKGYTRAQLYLRMDQLTNSIKQSYKNSSNQKLFPILNMKKFHQEVSNNHQSQILNSVILKYKMDPKDYVKISFILTIMGWQKKSMESIECAFCGRSVNIKEFKLTVQDRQKFRNQQLDDKSDQFFDLFEQHRYFCLWVYDQKGWQIYIQHLFDKLGQTEQLFKNQDPESMQKIRTMMDVYLQKFKNIIGENFEKAGKILTQCSEMAQQLEQNEEVQAKARQEVTKRKKQMAQFLHQIQSEVRAPLKRIKID